MPRLPKTHTSRRCFSPAPLLGLPWQHCPPAQWVNARSPFSHSTRNAAGAFMPQFSELRPHANAELRPVMASTFVCDFNGLMVYLFQLRKYSRTSTEQLLASHARSRATTLAAAQILTRPLRVPGKVGTLAEAFHWQPKCIPHRTAMPGAGLLRNLQRSFSLLLPGPRCIVQPQHSSN